MSIYHFQILTAADLAIHDRQGHELADDVAAEERAVQAVLELAWDNPALWRGCAMEVFRDDAPVVIVFFDEIVARNAHASSIADQHFLAQAA